MDHCSSLSSPKETDSTTEEPMSEYSPEELQQALQNVRNELNQGHMQEIMKVCNVMYMNHAL